MYKHSPYNGASASSNDHFDALDDEDLDDSFEQRMLRELNQERVENSRSARPQAFRRARPRKRGGLTSANLERIPIEHPQEPVHAPYESPGSTSSGGSNPRPNYPREWGTKGKRSSSWLRRITMDPAQKTTQANMGQDVDWTEAAADVPIPSVEDSPLSHRGSARGTPASLMKRNDSLEELLELEFSDDLTGASLIASTPAAVSRNTALDEIRKRELEISLEEEQEQEDSVYITSQSENRQNQIGPRAVQPKSVRSVSITRTSQQATSSLAQTWRHPAEQELQPPKRAQKSTVPITTLPNTTVRGPPSPVARKSSYTVGAVDREVTPQIQKGPKRPRHEREDSQDILRQLARASSGTPSPGRVMISGNMASTQQPPSVSGTGRTQAAEVPIAMPDHVHRNQSRELTQAISGQSGLQSDTPVKQPSHDGTASASNNKSVPDSPKKAERRNTVHEPHIADIITQGLEPKTPVVTGAWVDTPKPQTSRRLIPAEEKASPAESSVAGPSTASSSSITHPERTQTTKQILPSSALAAVVDKARENLGQDNDEGLGEATIQSLEDLMSPTGENSILEVEDTLDNIQLPTTKPRTAAERARQLEMLQLDSMGKNLRNTQRGLREVRHGIQRVEHRVAETKESTSSSPSKVPKVGQCENCDRPLTMIWRQAKSLFYTREDNKTTLTWPAIFFLVFLSWLLTETILWYVYPKSHYCSPLRLVFPVLCIVSRFMLTAWKISVLVTTRQSLHSSYPRYCSGRCVRYGDRFGLLPLHLRIGCGGLLPIFSLQMSMRHQPLML